MRFTRLLLTIPFFAAAAYAQTIPALSEVPACAPAADRTSLTQQRQALTSQRDQLRTAIARHDGACQNVPLNTPQAATCSSEQTQLNNDKNRHIDESKVFNLSIKAAEAICKSSGNLPLVASRVKGTISVDGRPLAPGDTMPLGARITTGSNSAVELQFSSGERMEVGPNSSFSFNPQTNEPAATRGAIRLVHDCAKGLTNCLRRVPVVVSPVGTASVRGTDFLLEVDANGTTISVFHGAVEVQGSSNPITLRDAQRVRIDSKGSLSAPVAIPAAVAPNWWN
jgi:hypothetical protein